MLFRRRLVCAVILMAFSVWSSTPVFAGEKEGNLLQKGAVINLELLEELSSQINRTGDVIRYRVVDDVKVGDIVVIERGAEALGRVVSAKPAKGWGKGGKLDISVETVRAIDGTNVPLTASMGDSQAWSAGKTIVGVAVLGLAFGGGMKGKKVTIGKGTKIDVFIGEDTTIGEKKTVTEELTLPEANTICFKLCENKEDDAFKVCMESCGGCKDTCGGLKADDLKACLSKCL